MTESAYCARLNFEIDPKQLLDDFKILSKITHRPQPGRYHNGEWSGLSLYSATGRVDDASAILGPEEFRATPALDQVRYIKEILDRLPCPKHSVRLLALAPGGIIQSHRDYMANFRSGRLRLHIPIVSHPDVHLIIAGHRQHWSTGALWYGDFFQPHEVENRSPITRYHLVMDIAVTEELLHIFPAQIRHAAERNGISFHRAPMVLSDEKLREYECAFLMPPRLLGLNVEFESVPTRLEARHGRLELFQHGVLWRSLVPVAENCFGVSGAPPGTIFEFMRTQNRLSDLRICLRGSASVEKDGHMEPSDVQWNIKVFDPALANAPQHPHNA